MEAMYDASESGVVVRIGHVLHAVLGETPRDVL